MNVQWWCSSTPGQIWTWRYTPFIGVWIVSAALIYGYVRIHQRFDVARDPVKFRRFLLGVLALFAVSEWPIGQLGVGYLTTVAITRYIVYTFVAAPLIVSSLPTELVQKLFEPGTRRHAILTTVTSWPVALLVFNAVLFGTHLPVTIDTLKLTQMGSFGVDVLHFSAAIIWWWPALRPAHEPNAIQEPVRAFYLFATSVLMFVPAAFLTFSPLPLYGLYELAPPLWLGFDAVREQQAAGIIMNVGGGLVLWAIIGTLFLRWAKQQQDADAKARRERDERILKRIRSLEAEQMTDRDV